MSLPLNSRCSNFGVFFHIFFSISFKFKLISILNYFQEKVSFVTTNISVVKSVFS